MKVKVKNRSKSFVGYTIPEDRINRTFAPGETKEIDAEELEKVTFQPGGSVILNEYLLISDAELAQKLNSVNIEPEYWMTEDEVKEVMLHGSLDRFLDVLDFAPEGVIDLIKSLAVSMPLNDLAKLEAIKEKFGFNAAKAIEHVKEAEVEETPEVSSRGRRVAINPVDEATSSNNARRVIETAVQNKYNVVHRS